MSLTLKEFIQAAENFKGKASKTTNTNLADDLLGKYEGIIPEGKNSSDYLRELRSTSYDKIKSAD